MFLSVMRAELTVLYAAARTVDAQVQLRSDLRRSSAATDRSLADLPVWPSSAADEGTPAMLRSRGLLGAVLARRRTGFVETGGGSGQFWDAMVFYTDVMDVVVGWLNRAVPDLHRHLRQHDRAAGYHLSLSPSLQAIRSSNSLFCLSHQLAYVHFDYRVRQLMATPVPQSTPHCNGNH